MHVTAAAVAVGGCTCGWIEPHQLRTIKYLRGLIQQLHAYICIKVSVCVVHSVRVRVHVSKGD
jgi:hypothetical protein